MRTFVSILGSALLICVLATAISAQRVASPAAEGTLRSFAPAQLNEDLADAPPSDALSYRFDHISSEQGLSGTEVWSVLRDSQGFMWFGTLDGLDRYDAYKMRTFQYSLTDPTSLSDSKIRTLYEDREGALWIGTWDGGLNRYDRQTETFTRFQHDGENSSSLGSNSVFAILEDRDGGLWLGTRGGGLDHYDPKSGVFRHHRNDPAVATSLANDNVYALWQDDDGTLWVGTDGGLDRFDPNTATFSHFRNDPLNPDSLSNDLVRALFADDSGDLWVGTWGGGLDHLDRKTGSFDHTRNDPNDPHSLSNDAVFSISQDSTGAMWIGTLGGGLNRVDPQSGTIRRFAPSDKDPFALDATYVYDSAVTDNRAWYATNNGIFALDLEPKAFHVLQHVPGDANSLGANEIDAIYEDPQGILWVSTAGSGLNRIERGTGQFSHFLNDPADPDSVAANEIWEIAPARDAKLWLATFGSGLDLFDPKTGKAIHFRHNPDGSNSLASDRVTSVLEDPTGVVWVGTWDAGMDRFDPATGVFSHFAHDPVDPASLGDNAIMMLSPDGKGGLWVGTLAGGLNHFDPGTQTFTHYMGTSDNPRGLPSNSVTAVLTDHAGTVWVATWGGGLARLNPDTGEVEHYDHVDGLPSDAVFGIFEDSQGLLWVSTGNGLSRFDPRTKTFRNYDENDGLPGNAFESSVGFQSPSGEIFFGATNGLLAFHPEQIRDDATVPPVVMTGLLLNNQQVQVGEGSVLSKSIGETESLKLSYLDRVISFEFAALNYSFPQKNRYRYQLEGFDQGWTEVGSDRRLVTYTNLDSGDYIFRVKGSNNDGIWNEVGASLALIITPPWWESVWFRGSALLLFAGVVAGGFVWQRRSAAKQQLRLEALVQERTHELQDARTQIRTLFDGSPLGIMLSTVEGRILGVNSAMGRITGYSEDELLQSNVSVLYSSPEQRLQAVEKLAAAGSLSDYGVRLQKRDRSPFYASLNVSRLKVAGNEVLLGTIDDITDQVKAHAALTSLNQISYDLASTTDLQTLIEKALQRLAGVVDFERVALMLVDEGEETFTLYACLSPTLPPELPVRHIPLEGWPVMRAILTGDEATYLPDMHVSESLQAELDGIQLAEWSAVLKDYRSWLALPLRVGERTVALLCILHSNVNRYSASDIELSRTFSNQLAVAIDNIHLNENARQTAAADERSRIARELHDSVTQTLFTASVIAEATPRIWIKNQDTARQNMDRISVLIRGALAEMRSLLLELRSSTAPTQTLPQLLGSLVEGARARSNAAFTLQVEGDRVIPSEIMLVFYRIAQEALNNAIKHAEATSVDVLLDFKADRVELHILDNGRGFDPLNISPGHLGISIMKERAGKIGGDLKIESAPGRGTSVDLIWMDPTESADDE